MTSRVPNAPEAEILEPPRPGRRRHYPPEQKRAWLEEAAQAGNSISAVARKYGLSPNLMFTWERTMEAAQ